jgi:hypothetical protein
MRLGCVLWGKSLKPFFKSAASTGAICNDP